MIKLKVIMVEVTYYFFQLYGVDQNQLLLTKFQTLRFRTWSFRTKKSSNLVISNFISHHEWVKSERAKEKFLRIGERESIFSVLKNDKVKQT